MGHLKENLIGVFNVRKEKMDLHKFALSKYEAKIKNNED